MEYKKQIEGQGDVWKLWEKYEEGFTDMETI
jgi:hypothetical protein